MASKKIVVLGTGGTIAGLAPDPGQTGDDQPAYRAGQVGVERLLANIPALKGLPLLAEQVAQVDSKDMGPTVWQALAARCAHWLSDDDVQGLVITHGTDTLEETAYFLHRVLAPEKPVVLTCAMRPADALVPDGPQNLVDAVAVARSSGAQGVVAVCAGQVHGAMDVAKVHPYRLDAFSSGDAGPIAWVEEGQLRRLRPWPVAADRRAGQLAAAVAQHSPTTWPFVEIVINHAGADGRIVDALVGAGARGLVAAGTGNGTLSQALEAALLRARELGVEVVRSTRCASGQVVPHRGDAIAAAPGLSPVKARVALLLDLLARLG